MIPLWVGVAVAAVAVLRLDRRDERTPGEPVRLSPEALLAERFASGDVDETEYLHRLSVLHPNVAKSRPSNPTQPHQ
ncbi:hypothetical protein [Nocardia sp. CS682]|uniref:hypothetical protein n=1 Tax=Nocardia sp. CS682 TaxID=1047172 RepID=UPI00197FBB16|nr:hypothetical protein [Nocardia sp. CS682]